MFSCSAALGWAEGARSHWQLPLRPVGWASGCGPTAGRFLCWSLGSFPCKLFPEGRAWHFLRRCEPGASFGLVIYTGLVLKAGLSYPPHLQFFSSLAAPVPKSQKGQGPGPVSRGAAAAGLLGGPSPRALPPALGRGEPWLTRNFSCCDGGHLTSAPCPVPPRLHSPRGPERWCGAGTCHAAPRQAGAVGLCSRSLGARIDPACHFQQVRAARPREGGEKGHCGLGTASGAPRVCWAGFAFSGARPC